MHAKLELGSIIHIFYSLVLLNFFIKKFLIIILQIRSTCKQKQ